MNNFTPTEESINDHDLTGLMDEEPSSAMENHKGRKIKFRRLLVYAMGFAIFESIATVVSAVINELLVVNRRTLWTDLAIDMSYSLILAIGFGLILGLFDPGKIRRWIHAGITAGCLLTLTNIIFNHVFGNLFITISDYRTLCFMQSIYSGLLLGITFGTVENDVKQSLILAGTIIVVFLTIGFFSNAMYHTYYLFLADGWSITYDVLISVVFGGLMGFFVGIAKEWNNILFVEKLNGV